MKKMPMYYNKYLFGTLILRNAGNACISRKRVGFIDTLSKRIYLMRLLYIVKTDIIRRKIKEGFLC